MSHLFHQLFHKEEPPVRIVVHCVFEIGEAERSARKLSALQNIQVAISELQQGGVKIEKMKEMTIGWKLAKSLYEQHKGKFFYDRLITHIISGPVIAMRVSGAPRASIGSSRLWPRVEPENQPIRQKLALSDVRNVAHASDEDVADKELQLFGLL